MAATEQKNSTQTNQEQKQRDYQEEKVENENINATPNDLPEQDEEIDFVSRSESKRDAIKDVVVLIDVSGSMDSWGDTLLEGYKEFLDTLSNTGKIVYVTTVIFYNDVDTPILRKSIEEAKNLTIEYGGRTALYDAIGLTIKNLDETYSNLPKVDIPDDVIISIITDGVDNDSKLYNTKNLSKLINSKKHENWRFVFLGASDEVCEQADALGIETSINFEFAKDKENPLNNDARQIFGLLETSIGRIETKDPISDINAGGSSQDNQNKFFKSR